MSDACDVCSRDTGETEIETATMMNPGGGRHIMVCGNCRNRIRHTRCRVCGDVIDVEYPGVIAFEGSFAMFSICLSCRRHIQGSGSVPAAENTARFAHGTARFEVKGNESDLEEASQIVDDANTPDEAKMGLSDYSPVEVLDQWHVSEETLETEGR